MDRTIKKKIITDNAKHPADTGSAQVQIAILTEKINSLSKHLKENPKDNHSRRGLLGMVGRRKKLLDYIRTYQDEKAYEEICDSLGIRRAA